VSTRFVVGADGALGGILTSGIGAEGVKLRHPGESLDAVVPEIADADVVVNLAGPRVRPKLGWADYMREHVGTALAVARAMRAGSHLIHFSSAAVYGAQPGLISLDTPESPVSFPNPSYAWAKLAGEHAARAVCRERGVRLSVVRPAMVYGPSVTSAIDTMFSLAKKKLLVQLAPAGVKQHCVHESLLVRAIDRLAERGPVSDRSLPLVDPFVFTNAELNAAVARKHKGLKVPAPLPFAEAMLRRWPIFPDRDGPGALAAFAFLGLGNEWDWRPLFALLALPEADFAKGETLAPYLESAS
jgi:nucleoside-diphosphate-sugar epimerase